MYSLSSWEFDPFSGILSLIVIPLFLFLAKIVLDHLKDWSSYALEGILYWFSHVLKHSFAAGLSLKRYCRLQVKGQNQYLHVPASSEVVLEIDQAYVPLILEYHGHGRDQYTHKDLLDAGSRIRVIGDPGSGKSSLVKRLLRDACHEAIENPSKSRLPILFELKNLDIPPEKPTQQLGDWFYEMLRTRAAQTAVYRMEDCFDNYAETTGLLILLDGLDEVSRSLYPRAKAAIQGLGRKLEQMGEASVVLLTMRTQFYQQIKGEYQDYLPHVMALKPFSPTEVYEFLTRWPFTEDKERNVTRIYNQLTDRPTLREMCTNPLILAMYVAEDQAAGYAVPPDTRTEFYSKVTEELLVMRRLRQTGPTVARTKLKEQRERILGRLAYEHLLDPDQSTNTLDWSKGLQVVSDVVGCNQDKAERVFRDIAKDTGLITEERFAESFRFIHLTFCEFLAANEAIQGHEDGWARLVERHSQFRELEDAHLHSRLLEVLPFACGLLPRVKRSSALSDLNRIGDRQLLARTFLETKLYSHSSWLSFLETERQDLLETPEENWDNSWLRRLHLFNVVIRDAQQCAVHVPEQQSAISLQEFFYSLIEKQQKSLRVIFSAYAKQDAAAAFRLAEICHLDLPVQFSEIVISNCDQRPFYSLVRGRALHETHRADLWASLLAEAAIRSLIVAKWLDAEEPPSEWTKLVREIPAEKRWWKSSIWSESFLTNCLSLALQRPMALGEGKLPMLDLISSVPAPGSLKFTGFWSILLLLLSSLFIGLAVATTFPADLSSSSIVLEIVRVSIGIVLWTVIMLALTRQQVLRQAYGQFVHGYKEDNKLSVFFPFRHAPFTIFFPSRHTPFTGGVVSSIDTIIKSR